MTENNSVTDQTIHTCLLVIGLQCVIGVFPDHTHFLSMLLTITSHIKHEHSHNAADMIMGLKISDI